MLGKCKACGFQVVIWIRKREESKRSTEGKFKWRKAEISFCLVCLKNKLNQQAWVDRNWKPSGLPLKSMNSIFIMLNIVICAHFWPPPFKLKKKKRKMHQCNGIPHFQQRPSVWQQCTVVRWEKRAMGGGMGKNKLKRVRWSRHHLWSAVKLNPLIPHPLLLRHPFVFQGPRRILPPYSFSGKMSPGTKLF